MIKCLDNNIIKAAIPIYCKIYKNIYINIDYSLFCKIEFCKIFVKIESTIFLSKFW